MNDAERVEVLRVSEAPHMDNKEQRGVQTRPMILTYDVKARLAVCVGVQGVNSSMK